MLTPPLSAPLLQVLHSCKCVEAAIRARLATWRSHPLRMAPHFLPAELDKIHDWSRTMTGPEVLRRLQKVRERSGLPVPRLRAVQKVMAGTTFRRGRD